MEYILEIREPTNCPGDWVTKLVYSDVKQAEAVIEKYTEDAEVEDITEYGEWDDQGPNWKRLKVLRVDNEIIITLDEVDTKKGENC